MKALPVFVLVALCGCRTPTGAPPASEPVHVGSKKFTESVIVAEMAADLAASTGAEVQRRQRLGGTQVLWKALQSGAIDIYPEYTGTISEEVFAGQDVHGDAAIRQALAPLGIGMSRSLGFNDTYALGMKETRAAALGVRTISDLRRHPALRFGFSNEFLKRGDGWPSLRDRYRLPQQSVRGYDHDLAYIGMDNGNLDVTDLYSTDAEIEYYHLRVLEDDQHHFPAYDAVLLYREDFAKRAPETLAAMLRLEGRIDEASMRRMNALAKREKERVPARRIAADFLADTFGLKVAAEEESVAGAVWRHTKEHLVLVGISLGAAILVAVPLGILAAWRPGLGQVLLGGAGIVQTIPSLALLVFLIPLLGLGGPPAVVALFLYSLLPIIRNTYAGLRDIPPALRESAEAIGLPRLARLWRIELPLAARTILAGIKTAAVINVGTATLGALIGTGGYGDPIFTGIMLSDRGLILQGAVPAAAMALGVQGLFELAERRLVPRQKGKGKG